MSILICVPCYGYTMHVSNFLSILSNLEYLSEQGVVAEILPLGGESLVGRVRNAFCANFLGSGHSFLCFVDADLSFDRDAIWKLLRKNVDCALAIYHDRRVANISIRKEDMTIKSSPLGLSLISRTCLEKLVQSFPKRKYTNDMRSYDNPRTKDNFYNFFGTEIINGKYCADYETFAHLCHLTGMKFHVVPDIKTSHKCVQEQKMCVMDILENKNGAEIGAETSAKQPQNGTEQARKQNQSSKGEGRRESEPENEARARASSVHGAAGDVPRAQKTLHSEYTNGGSAGIIAGFSSARNREKEHTITGEWI